VILVAGGTGFIGSAIVSELAGRGRPVAVLTHRAELPSGLLPVSVEARRGDVRMVESLPPAMRDVETAVSCVQFSNFPVENPSRGETFLDVDARGNEHLVAAARAAGVRNYIYISGVGASPDAAYHWFRAKWRAEEAIRNSGLRYTILRPAWVYGPRDRALNRFVDVARRLPVVPVIGDGSQRLQPVFVQDLARVVLDSLEAESAANQTFEIGGPDVLSMDEVLRTMLDVLGKRKPLVHTPAFAPRLLGRLMDRLPMSNKPVTSDAVTFVTMNAIADNESLLRAFPDLRLRSLREGLAIYLTPEE
jgi:uncharacterized protein YbjT (DUF2867 family)